MMSSTGMHIAVLLVSSCSVSYGSPFERVGGKCLTIGGAQVGVPCIFPFKARGVTYTECTKAGGFATPWCSTKVDASGNTVLGNYGDCPASDADCYPTTQAVTAAPGGAATGPCLTTGGADVGVPCVFPFKARGVTYTSCTFAGGFATPWCSTKVDASGNTVLGNYGDCPMNDPTCPNDAATTAAAVTSPAETSPAETSPAETSPAETSPAETSPAETSPAETSPAETSPAETSPAETSPAETSPAETSPAKTSPAETSPAETSPAETSPAETSPAETSPAETSPAETSPAETSAAETSPDATTVAACMTVSGAQVGVPCVFPFTDPRGVTYESCTVAGGYTTPWCATKVDAEGINVLGNWGECPVDDPTCPNDITTMGPTMASSSAAPTTESTTGATPPDGGAIIRKLQF